jgi:hypothetical protein
MTVGEDGRRIIPCATPLAHDDGMSGSRMNGCLKSRVTQRSRNPIRRARGVGVVIRTRTHTRNPKQLEQLIANSALVLRKVGFDVRGRGHAGTRLEVWDSRFEVRV